MAFDDGDGEFVIVQSLGWGGGSGCGWSIPGAQEGHGLGTILKIHNFTCTVVQTAYDPISAILYCTETAWADLTPEQYLTPLLI